MCPVLFFSFPKKRWASSFKEENASPSNIEAEGGRVAERNKELACWNPRLNNEKGCFLSTKESKKFGRNPKIWCHCHFHPFDSRRHNQGCCQHSYKCFENHGQSFGSWPQRHQNEDWAHATQADRTGHKLSFETGRAGGWLSHWPHQASDSCRSGLFVQKVS